MFRIIKEYIIGFFKEDREEARAEAEQEKRETLERSTSILNSLTHPEMIVASMTAHFYDSIFWIDSVCLKVVRLKLRTSS